MGWQLKIMGWQLKILPAKIFFLATLNFLLSKTLLTGGGGSGKSGRADMVAHWHIYCGTYGGTSDVPPPPTTPVTINHRNILP